MFDLCKILGVEEGEVFNINGAPYKIEGNRFKHKSSDTGEFVTVSYSLNLLADAEFEQLPFIPKFKERYFYVLPDGTVKITTNDYYESDLYRITIGNCFRTEILAIQQGKPLMEQLKKELGW